MSLHYLHACEVCGKTFVNIHGRSQMYCGNACKHLAARGAVNMEKTCPHCGKTFSTFDGRQAYCSAQCRIDDRRDRKGVADKLCIICGKPLPRRKGGRKTCSPECGAAFQTDNSTKVYCSQHCASVAKHKRRNRRRPYARTCRMCGKEFQTERPFQVCCSRSCSMRWQHALGLAPRKGHDKLQVFANPYAAADEGDMVYGNIVYF